MATSRRTGDNETVATYGTGKTYTALGTWEAATDIDLTDATGSGDSKVLECYDTDAEFDDHVDLKSATTEQSPLHARIIRPAAGEGHDGTSNNGVFFHHQTTITASFQISESFSSIQDLIVKANYSDLASKYVLKVTNSCTNALFVGCICFDCINSGAGITQIQAATSTDSWWINILYENGENHGFESKVGAGNTAYYYNCTSVNNGNRGWSNSSGTAVCKNCLADTNGGDDFESGTYTGSDYNSASDTTDPDSGTNNRTEQAFTFVNEGGNDYHLASDDGGAKDFGVDLSADGEFAFDDDIDGVIRAATWDIGFDEFVAAVAAGVSLVTAPYTPT